MRKPDSGRSQTNSQWQGDLQTQQSPEGRQRQPAAAEDQAEQEKVQQPETMSNTIRTDYVQITDRRNNCGTGNIHQYN